MPSKIQEVAFAHRKKIIAPIVLAMLLLISKLMGVDVTHLAPQITGEVEQAVVAGRMSTVLCFSDADCVVADAHGVCGIGGTCQGMPDQYAPDAGP